MICRTLHLVKANYGDLRGAAGESLSPASRERRSALESGRHPALKVAGSQAKQCPCCGTVTQGELPAHVRARASYGPETCAQAVSLVSGHRALAAAGLTANLADFAMVQSYLSTAAKWGISKLDALRGLFRDHAWLPPGPEPAG
jgi:transposase